MSAAQYDFEIEQGSSFRISWIYKDSNGSVIDISDWCGRLTWKTNTNTVSIYSTTNVDYTLYKFSLDGPNGKLTLEFPSSTTNGFDFTNAKYDLELQSDEDHYASGTGGGKFTTRLLFGTVTINKRFSKSTTALDCT